MHDISALSTILHPLQLFTYLLNTVKGLNPEVTANRVV